MVDALETELIGVTLPKKWIQQIDQLIKDVPMTNRQDFIRDAVKEKLEAKQ
jgi:metal-responsive CopG/Arc/MetJ family transcriptional regulator